MSTTQLVDNKGQLLLFSETENLEDLATCKECNSVIQTITQIKNGVPRCPICFPTTEDSSKQELISFCKEHYPNLIVNDNSILNNDVLDIYIPEINIAISFDSLYDNGELSISARNYHLMKTIKCRDRGVFLFHILEDEWNQKKDIVKSILLNKLGKSPNVIFARNCQVQIIRDYRWFLETNHIQGAIASSINIGLVYNNEVVSMLNMGKSRYNKGYEYEISRFCCKLNTSVVGGFSKLFKYFISEYKPSSVITYADRRYSDGNLYRVNGFDELPSSDPNYYYYRSNKTRWSRVKFQKHKLHKVLKFFDPNLTEWQNMSHIQNGYDRIWDCGNHVFGKKFTTVEDKQKGV